MLDVNAVLEKAILNSFVKYKSLTSLELGRCVKYIDADYNQLMFVLNKLIDNGMIRISGLKFVLAKPVEVSYYGDDIIVIGEN